MRRMDVKRMGWLVMTLAEVRSLKPKTRDPLALMAYAIFVHRDTPFAVSVAL